MTDMDNELRERCKALASKLQRDAMLRQNSPVDSVLEFVVSEIGRAQDESLSSSLPLCLYFKTEEDRAGFIEIVHEAKPEMTVRRVGK